ncbi:hypothetical protein HAHE_25100 [Haloferula helveola]|uniref:Uncharacterized protein n=1 Tax=Haloferula helveola TaxID=490095 RepID=A0ABM7REQ6_9BACT|nr:hypothetical protein HAHE_25100 [Haloferula helveola]
MDHPELDQVEELPARDLLRLPLPAINILLRSAEEATKRARSRENWLRAIREEKAKIETETRISRGEA